VELNLSLFWVIAFILVLAWTLERTLIKPLMRVMQEREQALRQPERWLNRQPSELLLPRGNLKRKEPRLVLIFSNRWTR